MSSAHPRREAAPAALDVPALERRPARGQVPLDAAHVVAVRGPEVQRVAAAGPAHDRRGGGRGRPVEQPAQRADRDLEAVLRALRVTTLPEPLQEPFAVHGQRRVQGERPQERLVLRAQQRRARRGRRRGAP